MERERGERLASRTELIMKENGMSGDIELNKLRVHESRGRSCKSTTGVYHVQ